MLLRKHLEGKKIASIEQEGFDRIIKISTNSSLLIFELFSSGNVILCSSSGEIIMPLRRQEWRDREIKPKTLYKLPPVTKGPFSLELFDSEKEIVKALAVEMGLSGPYAEEVCLRARIDKGKIAKELGASERTSVEDTINKMLKEGLKPRIVFENGKKLDVVPFIMNIYDNFEVPALHSFSDALGDFFREEDL